jgi:glycosyltransferase involved in cell wall biosynthesis
MRVAIVSTFPPRPCGIGTFANDLRRSLLNAPGVEAVEKVTIVNDPAQPPDPHVAASIAQPVRGDYLKAARTLGRLDVDVVLLQHEFGIFGGRDGEYVLSLAEEVEQPLVVTLHTVLSKPTDHQARILTDLCGHARLVTVMTETARRLAVETQVCDDAKIRVVPHGAPPALAERAREPGRAGPYSRSRDRFVLSTFGLISANKGIELMIDALSTVVARHPEVLYIVAGQTHPEVVRREGERYRSQLEQLVLERDLEDNVIFDDRFLTDEDLADLLASTSVFVTPYRDREQTASGALTFGIAAGCAVVSTPYWYAEDMLASGAGRLVPFGDAAALAETIQEFIEQPSLLAAARAEATRVSETLAWPSVAEATAEVLAEAKDSSARRDRVSASDWHYNRARVDHLLTLTDDVGIIQHADGLIPNRGSGYCVDDVARLVPVALELARRKDQQTWMTIVLRSLGFLADAIAPTGMHNLMSYDRRWLDDPHPGDHVGRTVEALAETLDGSVASAVLEPAERLLGRLVAGFPHPSSPRTSAFAILGLARLDPERMDSSSKTLIDRLVDQLVRTYEQNADQSWRWFENELTYDNARLSQALIVGGLAVGRDDATDAGLESLRWLGDECGLDRGMLRLPGNQGRRRGEPAPGAGDEQPLDACAFVEAELAAFEATSDREHCRRAQLAFDWFLGRNRLHLPLYDFSSGGCSDGIGDSAINGNQGAESTLSFHRAALAVDAAGLSATLHERSFAGISS